MTARPRIRGGAFTLSANGFADGPAEALRDFLLASGARSVTQIAHPLVAEGPTRHRIVQHLADGTTTERSLDPRIRPPYSFGLDPLIPVLAERTDGWFGFNCLSTGRGLVQRRLGLARRVVHWSVDFVPDRFGPGALTRLYERLDATCCRRADARVDLSEAALEARDRAYGLTPANSPVGTVVPMGCWLDRTPRTAPANFDARRIVFLGHLVPRMGVMVLLDDVRARADAMGGGVATVHGFVQDHRDVERILGTGTIAAAPYDDDATSFTRWADPGKLKAYLGAGLPIVMPSTPPIAPHLHDVGVARLVDFDAAALAAAMREILADRDTWVRMHEASLKESEEYDWPRVLGNALDQLGFDQG